MADIELVIKIPEEEYRWIKKSDNSIFADIAEKECMLYAIKNGTPLPKGHGRLIDADNLIKLYETYCGNNCPYSKKEREFMCRACQTGDAIEMLEDEPTIIPADKEKEKNEYDKRRSY